MYVTSTHVTLANVIKVKLNLIYKTICNINKKMYVTSTHVTLANVIKAKMNLAYKTICNLDKRCM